MTRKPRILFLQTQAENAGAQEITRMLGEGLEPRGFDVHHLFYYQKSEAFDAPPNTVFCSIERPSGPVAFAAFLVKLVKRIREIKPDVVLTFQHYGNMFGAPAARIAGVRHVIANQVSAPEVISAPATISDKLWGATGIYDAITVNSVDTAGIYAGYPKSYKDKIVYVPHGFKDKTSALSKVEAREKFGLPQDVDLLGSVARLNHVKRLDVAIKALTHDESWHLVLGGDGPADGELRRLAQDLGVADRTHFTGSMKSDEVGDLLRAMDVFVFPSAAETFGLAAVEAAQAGLPIVANSIPVLHEVLKTEQGPCALFADIEQPESFVDPIRQILADDTVAGELIEASKGLKQLYSIEHMVNRYEDLIMEKWPVVEPNGEVATA